MERLEPHGSPAPALRTHGKMEGLTGLRAVAVVWVIAFHYSVGPFSPLHPRRAVPLFGLGYLGVDLFFMLSGFVIWHVHAADFARPSVPAFRRFLLLRIARLYPVYLFTLLLFAVLLVLVPHLGGPKFDPRNYGAGQFVVDLGMMQTWGLASHLEWNYPSWSISAEWFCCFLFPLAALSLARLGRGPGRCVAAAGGGGKCQLFALSDAGAGAKGAAVPGALYQSAPSGRDRARNARLRRGAHARHRAGLSPGRTAVAPGAAPAAESVIG